MSEHRAIAQALLDGDGERAETAMRRPFTARCGPWRRFLRYEHGDGAGRRRLLCSGVNGRITRPGRPGRRLTMETPHAKERETYDAFWLWPGSTLSPTIPLAFTRV